jgi:WD40 repeat protein
MSNVKADVRASFIMSSFVAASVACGPKAAHVSTVPSAPGRAVSYTQVQDLFHEKCVSCHNTRTLKGGLSLETFDTLMAGGQHGPALVAGHSGESRLVQMLEGRVEPRMPYEAEPLAPQAIALVRTWIDAGAPGHVASEVAAKPAENVPTGRLAPVSPVLGAVAAVAFDPAAARIAAGTYHTVYIMDAAQGKWLTRLTDHVDLVRAVAFSPDGTLVAAASGASARFGEIKLWNVASGALVRTWRGHTDSIYSIAFSPSGAELASASYDRLIKIWDAASGREITTLKEHNDAVYSIAFLPDGRQLVSAAGDRTVKIWDVATGRRVFTMSDATDALYAVAVHPRGSEIAAGGADRMIRTWSWTGDPSILGGRTATLRRSTFAHGDSVLRLAYAADGKTLVSTGADRMIKVWDAETLRERVALELQPDWVMDLALSPDGKRLVVGRYDGTLGIYDLTGETVARQFTVGMQ